MTKPSKTLVVKKGAAPVGADPFALHAIHVQRFNHLAMMHANQSVAAAILCGAELLHVQKELRKSPSGWTFEQWLSNSVSDFGRSTAFKYTKLASEVRKALPTDIAPLLNCAPSDLNAEQQKRLMLALAKKADGAALTDLYIDYGIVPAPRKISNSNPANNGSDSEPPVVTVEEKVQEQLDLFGKYTMSLDAKIEEGGTKMLLLFKWPDKELNQAIVIAKRNLRLLVKVKRGRAGK